MRTAKRTLTNDTLLETSQVDAIAQYHRLSSKMDILFYGAETLFTDSNS